MQLPGRWKVQGAGAVLTSGRTLVLGVGNPIRRDDGVGPIAARFAGNALTSDERLAVEVRALDSGGWNLIPEIEGFDGLIIVDAYFGADSKPGRVRTHRANDFAAAERPPDSAHLIGLSDALRLSKNLGYHTPSLIGAVTVDVGESCMTFGEGLSPEIEAAVPVAAGRILELVLGVLKTSG